MRRSKKIWGTREKSSLFPYKRTALFSGTPNVFGPSYFEAALGISMKWKNMMLTRDNMYVVAKFFFVAQIIIMPRN